MEAMILQGSRGVQLAPLTLPREEGALGVMEVDHQEGLALPLEVTAEAEIPQIRPPGDQMMVVAVIGEETGIEGHPEGVVLQVARVLLLQVDLLLTQIHLLPTVLTTSPA